MHDVFVARQPIYSRELDVIGYELLFRSNTNNQAMITDGDEATSQVIINSLIEIGLQNLVGNLPAYINVTRQYVVDKLPFPLATQQVVLEILEDIAPDVDVIESLREITQDLGYHIALDDFVYDETKRPMMQYATVVKIDVMALGPDNTAHQVDQLKPFNVKLVAEKVETQEEFQLYKDMGFDYFQGYFFCKPMIVQGQRTPNSRLSILRLVARLQDPDISFAELESLVANDVSMSYRILRYINTAAFGFAKKVESIKQAIALLGLKTIKTWVTIIAMSQIDDKPYELMITSIVRGKMCELLAEAINEKRDADFIVGLFSTLDALMDKPIDDVLNEIPLSDEVNHAILEQRGSLGKLLKCVISHEQGDWVDLDELGLDSKAIQTAYFNAIRWAGDVSESLLKPA